MGKIRVLIADHDPVARSVLRTYVQQYPRAEVIGESAVGCKAVETIRGLSPDVVLLELELPEFNGFEILRRLGVNRPPIVVFVTPHKNYAVEAFEVQAFDYILKPVSQERVTRVLDRVIEHIARTTLEKLETRLQELLHMLKIPDGYHNDGSGLHRIVIRQNGRIFFLDPMDVDWIEACANYTIVHVGQAKYLLKETMKNIESKLNGGMFLRVHRSAIVNMRSVKEFRPFLRGSYVILLKDNTKIYSSRRHQSRIHEFLRDLNARREQLRPDRGILAAVEPQARRGRMRTEARGATGDESHAERHATQ